MSFIITPIFWLWGLLGPLLPLKKQVTRTILHKWAPLILQFFLNKHINFRSSGALQPREMCLVLGCPGSGCSTFLKTIADQRDGYLNVSGEVLYAGIDANEMLKYYKGEVVYNQEGWWRDISTALRRLTIQRRWYAYSDLDCGSNVGLRIINVCDPQYLIWNWWVISQ